MLLRNHEIYEDFFVLVNLAEALHLPVTMH